MLTNLTITMTIRSAAEDEQVIKCQEMEEKEYHQPYSWLFDCEKLQNTI